MLTTKNLEDFDRDGFLILPDVFRPEEIDLMKSEITRLAQVSQDVVKEKSTTALRMFYRIHDERSATPSPLFQQMARTPRLLASAHELLRDEQLYMFHSKCNVKEAIDGEIWQWHQDFGVWKYDGMPTGDVVTALVVVDEASEIGGCLYFIPGSHKLGLQEPEIDHATSAYTLRMVPKPRLIEIMNTSPKPVPITAKRGSVVFFHGNTIHASGHNLWKDPRWHLYFVYNPILNKTADVESPRGEYVRSLDFRPLELMGDDLTAAAQASAHA